MNQVHVQGGTRLVIVDISSHAAMLGIQSRSGIDSRKVGRNPRLGRLAAG